MKPTIKERELAWIGDAVLSLFARTWILRQDRGMDQPQLEALTSNQFLSCLGNPTRVEAEIGRRYQTEGLAAAFVHIESNLIPLFLKQQRNRS